MPIQERVELASLGKGDLIRGIDRLDPDLRFFTDLLVVKTGESPICLVSFTDPNGTHMSQGEYALVGSANYVIDDDRKRLTINPGFLKAGEELILRYPDPDGGTWILPKCESFE